MIKILVVALALFAGSSVGADPLQDARVDGSGKFAPQRPSAGANAGAVMAPAQAEEAQRRLTEILSTEPTDADALLALAGGASFWLLTGPIDLPADVLKPHTADVLATDAAELGEAHSNKTLATE